MIELVFSACLLSAPADCRDVSLTFSGDSVTELQCSLGMAGQVAVAQWIAAHPTYFAKRRTCRAAGMYAKA